MMRQVEGYVCLAKERVPVQQERLFGRNTGGGQQSHESFTTNNLTPFETPQEALIAIRELEGRKQRAGFTRVTAARIQMEVWRPLTPEARTDLTDSLNLVVAAQSLEDPKVHHLFGRLKEGVFSVGHLPGSLLEVNQFSCFPWFGAAEHCAYEIERQGQHRAWIGRFGLYRVSRAKLSRLQ